MQPTLIAVRNNTRTSDAASKRLRPTSPNTGEGAKEKMQTVQPDQDSRHDVFVRFKTYSKNKIYQLESNGGNTTRERILKLTLTVDSKMLMVSVQNGQKSWEVHLSRNCGRT